MGDTPTENVYQIRSFMTCTKWLHSFTRQLLLLFYLLIVIKEII